MLPRVDFTLLDQSGEEVSTRTTFIDFPVTATRTLEIEDITLSNLDYSIRRACAVLQRFVALRVGRGYAAALWWWGGWRLFGQGGGS